MRNQGVQGTNVESAIMSPYEGRHRLDDFRHQQQAQSILGLENEVLTETQLPRKGNHWVGAGRVKAFAQPASNIAVSTSDGVNHVRGDASQEDNSASFSGAGHSHRTGNVAEEVIPAVPDGDVDTEDNASGRYITNIDGIDMTQPSRRVAGYAALADFMASDKVFCIFRRFDSLSIRNLLHMQDELAEIEERLKVLDAADLGSGNARALYSLHSRRHDRNEERGALMATLADKLYQYRKRLYLHSQCLRMEKARDMYVDSVSNWVDGRKPVIEEESHFLDNRGDLASLGLKVEDYHIFEKWVEKRFPQAFATRKHQGRPLFGAEIQYYSSTTIRRVVRCILTLVCVVVLIGPLFALTYTRKQEFRLALIACFSLIFAFAIALATKSRNFEIFVAMAAYAAVLVVFVGNNNGAPQT